MIQPFDNSKTLKLSYLTKTLLICTYYLTTFKREDQLVYWFGAHLKELQVVSVKFQDEWVLILTKGGMLLRIASEIIFNQGNKDALERVLQDYLKWYDEQNSGLVKAST